MSINELKIYLDLSLDSKSKVLDRYTKKFYLGGYFFVDSEDGQCYLFDSYGEEKDVSLVNEINRDMISRDIQKIVIPNGIMSIGNGAFWGCCKLTNVTIPNSVTSIKDFAFLGCGNLANMTIPDSVTYIGYDAFSYCNGLTHVAIPNRVTNISRWAFEKCRNLKSLIFKNKTLKQVKSIANYPFGIKDESIIKVEFD